MYKALLSWETLYGNLIFSIYTRKLVELTSNSKKYIKIVTSMWHMEKIQPNSIMTGLFLLEHLLFIGMILNLNAKM